MVALGMIAFAFKGDEVLCIIDVFRPLSFAVQLIFAIGFIDKILTGKIDCGLWMLVFRRSFLETICLLTQTVIQSEAKNLANIHVNVLVYAIDIFRFAQQYVFLPSVVWMAK